MPLSCQGRHIPTDKEGYLQQLGDWGEDVARQIATNEGISLSEQHWQLIRLAREFYETYELSPAMRPLVKYIGQQLGKDKGSSIYLLRLFPGNPAKLLCKIAGLPRPTHCL